VSRRLNTNTVANLVGRIGIALCGVVFVPVYVRLLGAEAYGLVGAYGTLQAVTGLLDLGLGASLTREIARASTLRDGRARQRDLLRSLELLYWLLSVAFGGAVLLAAPTLAGSWLNRGQLPLAEVSRAFALMAVSLLVQFPSSLYQGGLGGLERQLALNVVLLVAALLRFAGVIVALRLWSPTISTFFAWQIVVAAVQTSTLSILLWRSLSDRTHRPQFRMSVLREVWRFAGGVTAITLTSVVLTQMDKVIVGRALPLAELGYYSIAGSLAGGIASLGSPFFSATFPVFNQLVAIGDSERLRAVYHERMELLAAIVLPVAVVLSVCSREVLLIWTRNPTLAEHVWLPVTILVAGSTLLALAQLPYALQLAHGATLVSFWLNLGAIIVLGPSLTVLTLHYGIVGAALVWPVLNGAYVLIQVPLIHLWYMRGATAKWFFVDVGRPLVAILCANLMVRVALSFMDGSARPAAVVLASAIASCVAVVLVVPSLRRIVGIRKRSVSRRGSPLDGDPKGAPETAEGRSTPYLDGD
jgi:O-antigen/teichoic acid export membrane protein